MIHDQRDADIELAEVNSTSHAQIRGFPPRRVYSERCAPVIILLLFLGQGLAVIRYNSQTIDELPHFAAGYSYWATGDFRLNTEHPPLVKQLCLLPVYLLHRLPLETESELWQRADQFSMGFKLLYESGVDADWLINLARLPNLVLGVLLVALIGWWSYRLWGPGGALLGMTLAAMEPNLVAHSSLVTTDVGWTAFATATLYAVWEFSRASSLRWLLVVGLATGLALASKYSAVSLLVVVPAALVIHCLAGGRLELIKRRGCEKMGLAPSSLIYDSAATVSREAPVPFFSQPRSAAFAIANQATQIALAALMIASISLLVVCSAYFFEDPWPWWHGFQHVLSHQERGHPAYLWGDYSTHGWPLYFPVALAIKTQLATLILSATSLLLFWKGKPLGRDGVAFLLLPLWLFFSALLLAQINIGVRHALHLYPLLHVLAGRVATISTRSTWPVRVAGVLLLALCTFSLLRVMPYPIAYFNELVGGPAGGRHILTDSNVDWGQGLRTLAKYMRDENVDGIYFSYFGNAPPEYYSIRYQYVPAFGPLRRPAPTRVDAERQLLAISDMNLKGVWFGDRDRYHWLNSRRPIAALAQSIYMYDITHDADAHFELAKVYLAEGLREYVDWELEKVLALEPTHPQAAALRATSSN